MEYEVSALIQLPVDTVWRWWTDFGPVGGKERVTHGIGWSDRTLLSHEGDTLVLRESVLGIPLMTHHVELHPARHAFKETAGAFTAWWHFEPAAGDGPEGAATRVRRQVSTTGRPPRRLVVWMAQKDLDHHARQCEGSHLS